ncbi:MAG TPA: YIP1 family protein, partial [Paracoccaceae bacterium]|nr:YIP1 family protein [Paracoccaceae bacterium]
SLLLTDTSLLPPFLRNPLMFFFIVTGIFVLTIHAFYWAGRAMGGHGDLGDLLKLMVWLQGLRAIAQAVLFVLMLVAPLLGNLFSLAVGILGLWITVHFITVALNLGSVWRGFGVMLVAGIGLVFGIVFLIGLIGLTAIGVPANV